MKISWRNSYLLTVLLLNCYGVEASNILFFHTVATASHRTSIWPLAVKLADAGHKITYIFPISRRPGSDPRIEEILPSKAAAAVENFVGDFDINFRLNNSVDQWLSDAFDVIPEFCEAFYRSPETHEWLSRPGLHYDLIMMDGGFGQCAYGLVHKFKAKHVLFLPVSLPFLWDSFGIVPETSSVPEMMFHKKPASMMTSLWSRTLTTISTFIWKYSTSGGFQKMEMMARKYLNLADMPSFAEIEKETSLVLHNTYFIEDYPLSLPPFFVSYSGLSCNKNESRNRKPLPENLKSFIEDKDSDGFVYVSLGSAVIMSAIPDQLRQQFMDAFAAFPKLKFLWRWTGEEPKNLPRNVLVQSWFPQQDVLAHPKIKAFITQAGRPSSQEAFCHDVPMISFPIFGDQDFNADRLESIGVSISLDIATVTAEELTNAIHEITETPKYKKRMTQLSQMFKDRPLDPLENAHYWIEYVLKYDTSLMKPLAMQQTWWQRRLLDVYAILIAVFITICGVFMYICVLIVKIVRKFLNSNVNLKTKND